MQQVFKQVFIYNPSKEDYVDKWDGVEYVMPAGKTVSFPAFLGKDHFVRHNPTLQIVDDMDVQFVKKEDEEVKEPKKIGRPKKEVAE